MDKVKDALAKALVWVKGHLAIVIAIAVVLVVAIVGVSFLSGGPKRAVNKYVKAYSKLDADKVLKACDVKGMIAWQECDGKAKDFEDAYDDVDDDEVEEREDSLDDSLDYLKDNYEKYSMKVEKIKKVEKEKNCKGLYKVKAKVKLTTEDEDGDEDESSKTMTFVVYKNKVIGTEN